MQQVHAPISRISTSLESSHARRVALLRRISYVTGDRRRRRGAISRRRHRCSIETETGRGRSSWPAERRRRNNPRRGRSRSKGETNSYDDARWPYTGAYRPSTCTRGVSCELAETGETRCERASTLNDSRLVAREDARVPSNCRPIKRRKTSIPTPRNDFLRTCDLT